MFKNGNTKSQKPQADVTVINRGTTVEGEVEVTGTIRIYGCLNGTLRSEGKVVVAEEGTLKGDLYAHAADVSGTVEGIIEADRLDLRSTATVEGNVIVKKFTTETGAIFIGDCTMPQNGSLPSGQVAEAPAEEAAEDEATSGENNANGKKKGQEKESENESSQASSVVTAENGGVKPLPNKPEDSEPQAEGAEASDADDDARPRFW